MRERVAYLFMLAVFILLIAIVFAVLGRGEYSPPPPREQQEQGNVPPLLI